MNNQCLMTKLKSNVADDSLLKLSEFRFKIDESSINTTDGTNTVLLYDLHGDITLSLVSGEGRLYNYGMTQAGDLDELPLPYKLNYPNRASYRLTSNGEAEFSIDNKYGIKGFDFRNFTWMSSVNFIPYITSINGYMMVDNQKVSDAIINNMRIDQCTQFYIQNSTFKHNYEFLKTAKPGYLKDFQDRNTSLGTVNENEMDVDISSLSVLSGTTFIGILTSVDENQSYESMILRGLASLSGCKNSLTTLSLPMKVIPNEGLVVDFTNMLTMRGVHIKQWICANTENMVHLIKCRIDNMQTLDDMLADQVTKAYNPSNYSSTRTIRIYIPKNATVSETALENARRIQEEKGITVLIEYKL